MLVLVCPLGLIFSVRQILCLSVKIFLIFYLMENLAGEEMVIGSGIRSEYEEEFPDIHNVI